MPVPVATHLCLIKAWHPFSSTPCQGFQRPKGNISSTIKVRWIQVMLYMRNMEEVSMLEKGFIYGLQGLSYWRDKMICSRSKNWCRIEVDVVQVNKMIEGRWAGEWSVKGCNTQTKTHKKRESREQRKTQGGKETEGLRCNKFSLHEGSALVKNVSGGWSLEWMCCTRVVFMICALLLM